MSTHGIPNWYALGVMCVVSRSDTGRDIMMNLDMTDEELLKVIIDVSITDGEALDLVVDVLRHRLNLNGDN